MRFSLTAGFGGGAAQAAAASTVARKAGAILRIFIDRSP
jgi:hypothetical protein